MSDLIFTTGPLWEWRIVERNERFYCEQHSNEVMRFGADGSMSFGKAAPMKSYEFRTREFAQVCKHRMEEMDRAFAPSQGVLSIAPNGCRLAVGYPPANQFQFNLSGKAVFIVGPNGSVTHFDLPWFIWAWLRTTPLARGLKRFWYGERASV